MPTMLEWTPQLVKQFWRGVYADPALTAQCGNAQRAQYILRATQGTWGQCADALDYGSDAAGTLSQQLTSAGLPCTAYDPFADTPITPTPADVVFCSEVLEHALDLPALTDDLRRLTKRYVIVTVPNNETLAKAYVYCPLTDTMFHRWQHMRSFTRSTLRVAMTNAGFRMLNLWACNFGNPSRVARSTRTGTQLLYIGKPT